MEMAHKRNQYYFTIHFAGLITWQYDVIVLKCRHIKFPQENKY